MSTQNLGLLNGYLFDSLDRLGKQDLTEVELKAEVERSRTVADLADKIIKNGKLVLEAEKTYGKHEAIHAKAPEMLSGKAIEVINE